ncbi:hypothetical protein HZC53_00315 [Candidatus Uhrbacteria bacterium]|nr:hypothetical protein [Candidatus Uhrbacteria bacterium]
MDNQPQQPECCPKFDPTPWDGKIVEWQNKRFIKDKVFTLFFMPMNFGSVMKRLYDKVQKSGAAVQDGMWLSDHTSKWNMDLYLAGDKEVPGAKNVVLSGRFLGKAYEGEFKNTGKWMKDFEGFVRDRNFNMKKMFTWYTTCPKCAKKYGKNYVVLFAQGD